MVGVGGIEVDRSIAVKVRGERAVEGLGIELID